MTATDLEVVRHATPMRLTPSEVGAQVEEVKNLMRSVLTENTDYGTIPGTPKPSLYKSGAEWLLKWARLGHRLELVDIDRDADARKYGATYRCVIYSLDDPDAVVATCDGYCGYDEPDREEHTNRWGKLVPRSPWNTVLKMAQKRALVGATLQATATSGLFTQDIEDNAGQTPLITDEAISTLRSLPPEVRNALHKWRESEGIGSKPQDWSIADVCWLLVHAGRLLGPPPSDDNGDEKKSEGDASVGVATDGGEATPDASTTAQDGATADSAAREAPEATPNTAKVEEPAPPAAAPRPGRTARATRGTKAADDDAEALAKSRRQALWAACRGCGLKDDSEALHVLVRYVSQGRTISRGDLSAGECDTAIRLLDELQDGEWRWSTKDGQPVMVDARSGEEMAA